jgi:hypothetical protein
MEITLVRLPNGACFGLIWDTVQSSPSFMPSEEVAGLAHPCRLVDDLIYRFLENCYRPAFSGGSSHSWGVFEAVERGQAKVGVGDMDDASIIRQKIWEHIKIVISFYKSGIFC